MAEWKKEKTMWRCGVLAWRQSSALCCFVFPTKCFLSVSNSNCTLVRSKSPQFNYAVGRRGEVKSGNFSSAFHHNSIQLSGKNTDSFPSSHEGARTGNTDIKKHIFPVVNNLGPSVNNTQCLTWWIMAQPSLLPTFQRFVQLYLANFS